MELPLNKASTSASDSGPLAQGLLELPDVQERRILVGYPDSLATRNIRLTLEGMRNVTVDTSPVSGDTFERAMQHEYDLFVLSLEFPEITGEYLYSLIDKAYRFGIEERISAPPVLFMQEGNASLPDSLRGDCRIRGCLRWPMSMDGILEAIDRALPGLGKGNALS